MSRRPKPTAIKQLEGNPGGRPLNADEPKPKSGCPEMPKGLRYTAIREWKRITADLMELGVLTIVDGKALAMYCDAYADWEVAQTQCVEVGAWVEEPVLNKEGVVVGSKFKMAPWFTMKCMAMKLMKAFLIEYGLTPASRTKLKIEKKGDAEPLPSVEDTPLPGDDIDLAGIDETQVM